MVSADRLLFARGVGRVTPNPVVGGQQIRISMARQDADVFLFAASGQIILKGKYQQETGFYIPESLPAGVYYLNVVDDQQQGTLPLIIGKWT